MLSSHLKKLSNFNKILGSTTTISACRSRLYTTNIFKNTIINNNNNNEKGYQFKNNNENNNENNNNNKENNNKNNKNIILYSLSIGGLFGIFSKKEEPENPYGKVSSRVKGKPIESFEEALDWYTTYYTQPEPEQFMVAMKYLLGKQSKQFVRLLLENVKEESDMKSIARISTIQSFYYLPLVGFMIEMFKQNPTMIDKWYKELTENEDIKTPWKSALGDLDAIMLINLAVLLTENEQSKKLEQTILSNYYTPQDTDQTKKEKSNRFQGWAKSQKKSISSKPLILIGEYFASGKEDIVKQVSAIWRSSLDGLEVMGLQNSQQSNTTNNVVKRLEFQNREVLIEQLNQAIRLLAKDTRACNILKNEIEHQIKQKQERIEQYNKSSN